MVVKIGKNKYRAKIPYSAMSILQALLKDGLLVVMVSFYILRMVEKIGSSKMQALIFT
jgi:hypothetical protein